MAGYREIEKTSSREVEGTMTASLAVMAVIPVGSGVIWIISKFIQISKKA